MRLRGCTKLPKQVWLTGCWTLLQGYPISFSDFKMVLDNRVYQRLDVQWHDLFIRIKWDTIKSVLKSVAGLQGRKFKVPGTHTH